MITAYLGTFGKQRVQLKYVTVAASSLRAPGYPEDRKRMTGKRSVPARPPLVDRGIAALVGEVAKFSACPRHPLVFITRKIHRGIDVARVSAAMDRFPWFSMGSEDDWRILGLQRNLKPRKRQSYQVATDPPPFQTHISSQVFLNMPPGI